MKQNKKILFIAATTTELRVIKALVVSQPSSHMKADFLVTRIWNISTTLTLTQKLSQNKYDFVVNIWVCWYKQSKAPIIQIIRSVYAPSMKEILTPVFFEFAPLSSIYSSEVPLYNSNLMWDENYVDMESYAVEKVCEHFKVPRIILKVPYDKVGLETQNFDIDLACTSLRENIDIDALWNNIETYLCSLPQIQNHATYMNHYNFTVSEKIIFEKYFYKYITLAKKDFDIFFETYKHKNKKDFLQNLSTILENLSKL